MTLLGPVITHAVATAVIGTPGRLHLALKTNQTNWAQTVTAVALASIGSTVGLACLLGTRRAIPSCLTQTCGIISTVSVLAVRADWVTTVITTVTHVTFTSPCHTIALSVTRATVRTHALFTGLAHVASTTIADSIHTTSVVRAVTRASLQRAIIPRPSHLTNTMRSHTIAITRALIGAGATRAIRSSESSNAVA